MVSRAIFIVIALCLLVFGGCKSAPTAAVNAEMVLSLTAEPTVVKAGETSLLICNVTGVSDTTNLTYQWDATGAYGYLSPMGKACIFASPGCHSGPATVTVTVTNDDGSAVGTINLN